MTRSVTRRATIRTEHDDPETIARALAPDNTDEMETVVDGRTVRTRIERDTTGGLHSTVDDYVVNLDVAVGILERTGVESVGDENVGDEDEGTAEHEHRRTNTNERGRTVRDRNPNADTDTETDVDSNRESS